ncbi:MAG: hypothetical protein RL140_331 [Actinomycetota bacterium]|jgi:hypothetical protein
MNIKRMASALLIATFGLGTLTACDPPYPPELIETIYEQNPVCEQGAVAVSAAGKLEQLIGPYNDTMAGLCPEMSILPSLDNTDLAVTLDAPSSADENIYAATPLFVDGGVAVVYFSSGVNLTLSLDVLFKILSGEITNWNDPQIKILNKKIDPIDMPVLINPIADRDSLEALKNWARIVGVTVPEKLLVSTEVNPSIDLFSLQEGTISILPLSDVLNQGLTPSSIKVKSEFLNAVVAPTDTSVFAGASQFKAKSDGVILTLKQNPSAIPELPKGAESADLPYQAVFFGWQILSSEDNLLTRSVARFLLRMDEQGTLPTLSLVGLPTKIRQAATALVSEGLTLPKVTIKK